MYLEFIQNEVYPTIKKLLQKFSIWWTFQPESLLEDFLKDYNVILPQYFCPEELFNAILNIASSNGMIEYGNSNIIVADRKLQECFKTWYIYIPDLLKYCTDHVQPVNSEINESLKNDAVYREIYIEPPVNIIYNDPSSLFWLHPDINYAMNNNLAMTYSWKELVSLFENFCYTNKQHFIRIDQATFQIKPTSILNSLFKFKIFHKNQIEGILKSVTKFLGKPKTIEHCCKNFNPVIADKSLFNILDFAVNNCNKLIPYIYTMTSL